MLAKRAADSSQGATGILVNDITTIELMYWHYRSFSR
jgi:hypothetical protein